MIMMMEKLEMDESPIPATYENISSQVLELLHYEILFTLEQRRQGAVVIHFVICIYAFAALAILCDDYFCASLNKICKRLNIHPDVAGATFMAAGSSMPTMFISVTSVFLDEGDIGLGTIIGSTMFNILFITGICGVATSAVLNLKPYSIIRDSLCYVIYLIVLLFAMYDGMIYWYEATVVSLLYCFYVAVMCNNSTLEYHFNIWAKEHIHQTRSPSPQKSPVKTPTTIKSPIKSPKQSSIKSPIQSPIKSPIQSPINSPIQSPIKSPIQSPIKSPIQSPIKSPIQSPIKSPTQSSSLHSPIDPPAKTSSNLPSNADLSTDLPISPSVDLPSTPIPQAGANETLVLQSEQDDKLDVSDDRRSVFSDTDSAMPRTKYDEQPDDALTCPSGRWKRVRWTVMFPIRMLYYITIPDCRMESWEDCYVVTFVMSIAWMGVHSYVLVWAVSVIGVTINIPERIMGLTILAAGSSVPDAIASLVMAEQGMGDMALANAIGSNIFDMLCLSVPWLLSTTVVHPNSVVMIHGGNILYVSLTLFGTVAVTLVILYLNKWRLDKRVGCVMLIAYVFFLTTAVVIESFPRAENKHHPLHRSDLPHKGLGVPVLHKGKVKNSGFTWF